MAQTLDELFANGAWNPDPAFLRHIEEHFAAEGELDKEMGVPPGSRVLDLIVAARADGWDQVATYLQRFPPDASALTTGTVRDMLRKMREGTPDGVFHYILHLQHWYCCGPGAASR